VPDKVVEHGTQEEQYRECGYDVDSIRMKIKEILGERSIEPVLDEKKLQEKFGR
jgi:1-deoxy-D-xylulose-5-phosphate synthase